MSDEGRGALVGEFLQSFFAAPQELQDQIIFHAVKHHFQLYKSQLIEPFPVLSHLSTLIEKSKKERTAL